MSGPMEQLREVAPQLLDGDLGWKLRQEYAELSKSIQRWGRAYALTLEIFACCAHVCSQVSRAYFKFFKRNAEKESAVEDTVAARRQHRGSGVNRRGTTIDREG